MIYEVRHSERNDYWFVDRIEAGEGFSVVIGLTEEQAIAVANELNGLVKRFTGK